MVPSGYRFDPDGRLVPNNRRASGLGDDLEGAIAALLGESAGSRPLEAGEVTAEQALKGLAEDFQLLNKGLARLVELYSGTKGGVPCLLIAKHNAAVDAYHAKALNIFQQLYKQGHTVDQSVYNIDGTFSRKVRAVTSDGKNFIIVDPAKFSPCNATIKGANELGVAPIVYLVVMGIVALVGATAYVTVKLTSVSGPMQKLQEYKDMFASWQSCKSAAMSAGMTESAASAACALPSATGLSTAAWVAIAIGVGVLGGLALYHFTGAAGRARREALQQAYRTAFRRQLPVSSMEGALNDEDEKELEQTLTKLSKHSNRSHINIFMVR
jgi:hypothetical protein